MLIIRPCIFFDARDFPEGFPVDYGVDRGSSFRGLMVSKVARDVVVNTGNSVAPAHRQFQAASETGLWGRTNALRNLISTSEKKTWKYYPQSFCLHYWQL